jgi:S1-C subfamily serine protease
MEYIVGIEKGTKTDRFYQSLYEGDARLRQNKYLEAGESYKNAKDIFPNSDLVERREKKTYAISQAWNEFNQFKDFAEQSFVSGNYILAYDQIQSAEKSLNNYKYELKKLTSRTNVNAEESYVKSKKGQYEKAKIADHTYLEGVKLFEEKKYSYALSEFEKAKRGFEAADVSISGDLINKMEVCKSIIKRQEEEEKIKKIQNLIVTAKEKFKNEDYAGSLYDLNQILNGLDPNNIDAKNLKKEAEAKYQEQELKRRKKECDEHYDLALKLMEDGDLAEALIHIDSALDALESCERCVALKSKIEKEIENKKTLEFDKLVTEGDRLRDNGNFAEALLLYRRAKELIDNERIRAKIEDSERKYSQSITNSIGVAEIRGIVENSVFEVIVTHTFKNYPSQGGQGSGFFISTDGVALTNSHVTVPDFSGIAVELTKSFVERKMLNPSEQELLGYYEFYLNEIKKEYLYSSIEVIIHSGANKGKYKGRVLKENVDYMDTENDWSFIKVDGSGRKFGKLEIANSTPNIDEKVFAIGFPLNEEVSQMLEANNLTCTITEGKINNTVQPTKIPMSCNIDHGNSGGPLVNSRGKVIGINTWGLRDNSSGFLNYAINIKSLPYSQYIH